RVVTATRAWHIRIVARSKKRRSASSSSAVSSPAPALREHGAHGRADTHVPSEARSEDTSREHPWTRFAILGAMAALTAAFDWRTESSRDFGNHVATGRWILEHGSWPRVDSFTYTLSGRPYIDMHGLFQIALALAYRGGAMIGVGLFRVALALAIVGLLLP